MNKYMRKNGKKIMAVMGILLMIAFVLPTTSFGPGETNVGTIRNGEVDLTGREFNRHVQQWQLLKQHFGPILISSVFGGVGQLGEEAMAEVLTDPNIAMQLQQFASFRASNPQLYFQLLQMQPQMRILGQIEERGEQAYVQIEENPELFLLLAKEAESMGIGASNDLVETILRQRGITPEADRDLHASLREALRTLLSINNAASLATSVVKVSQPQRANLLAMQRQQVALSLTEFDAKDFLDKVPAPTDEQVKAHFEKYKAVEPEADAGPSNPLGFGYKYPHRVKYDAIVIKREDVRKGVPAIQPEDVAEYYLRNRGEFTATTTPTTQDTLSLGAGPTPTTRPMTLAEARERITTTLTDRRTTELMNKVRDAVRSTMKADYEAYRAATGGGATQPATGATTTAAAAPASSLGVPYNSYEYLQKLRDKIQADHKVTLTIEQQDAWQTPRELGESKLAQDAFTIEGLGVTFPQYMANRVAPFLSEDQRKELASRGGDNRPVGVWEPTPAFANATQDLLIARATAADPSHVPASLDEIKDKVAADVKLAAAYEQAKQAAQAAVDAAKSGKWLSAIAAERGKQVTTTGLFSGAEASMGAPLPINGYELKDRALGEFVRGTFKLLSQPPRSGGSAPRVAATQTAATTQPATTQSATTRPTATRPATTQAKASTTATTAPATAPAVAAAFKDHPVGLIEVPADGKVLVAEVEQLKPTWTQDRQGFFDAQTSFQARFETEQLLRQAWYQYDNVAARLNYAPAETREPKAPRQNRPINPFLGTAMP